MSPSGRGFALGSGCRTLELSEVTPEPCPRPAAGAVVTAPVALDGSASRCSGETFACLQQVQDGGEVQWKSWIAPLNGVDSVQHALWEGPTEIAFKVGDSIEATTTDGCERSEPFHKVILDCNLTAIDTQPTSGEVVSQDNGLVVPMAQECPSPITESVLADSQQIDSEEKGVQPTISPTCVWTHPCVEDAVPPYPWPKSVLLPAEGGLSDSDLLAAFRNSPLAELGADLGVTLVYRSQRARLQIMQAPASQLVSARAYMVQGDCCPTCFCEGYGWECSNCFVTNEPISASSSPRVSFCQLC